ncbi:hypothetical protein LR066_00140 [candidate division WOR-3 bacterium]|nr:hypothetical protein [candidate division WOR-3 bacterium]
MSNLLLPKQMERISLLMLYGISLSIGGSRFLHNPALKFGISYVHSDESLSVTSSIRFTKTDYDSRIGTRELNCQFSSLSISQLVGIRLYRGLFLEGGPSLYFLKNWVEETNRVGPLKITDYYALSQFAPGVIFSIGVLWARWSFRIMHEHAFIRGENIFYRDGNLSSFGLRINTPLIVSNTGRGGDREIRGA